MDEYIQNLLDVKEYKDLNREVIKSYNRLNNANIEEDLKYCYKQIARTTKKKDAASMVKHCRINYKYL